MKAILSSTYNDIYLFNLPIVAWAWERLGVGIIWFRPKVHYGYSPEEASVDLRKLRLMDMTVLRTLRLSDVQFYEFDCSPEKAATYAQVSRLFGCCLDLPEDEILVTSDIDMMVLKKSPMTGDISLQYSQVKDETDVKYITVLGADLVPEGQYPMCYVTGRVGDWRKLMGAKGKSYQECLDEQLASLEAEHFRGNYWSRDQELLWKAVNRNKSVGYNDPHTILVNRARPGTQFAENRLDRDDAYILDRLSPDIVDYHMHRPLWEPANFEKLMTIMTYFWPDEDFTWVRDYREKYIALL